MLLVTPICLSRPSASRLLSGDDDSFCTKTLDHRASLFVPLSDVVGDALPLLVSNALLIRKTPRCARIQVRGTPIIRHVVQTRTGTGRQQENKRNDGCDSHARHQRCRSSAAKAPAIEAVRPLHDQLLSNSWLKLDRCILLASMHAVCSLSNR